MRTRYLAAILCCMSCLSLRAADAPLPPDQAAAHMTLPEGFSATLFAGEPDVVQPIAMTFDDRGRLWVVECYTYPEWKPERKDRVLIFEDRDGDGHFDTRKVFWDQGSNLSGIALGFGGVWLCSTPNLIFVPDANGDDVPDGPPITKLDGWDITAKHNVFNSLAWGPDGWLYGCNGILSNSKVGKPGTPDEHRAAINCGVWRYHPTKEIFEAFAHGTTNPWGLDWDDNGELFITNCVISHLWHVVPGARFERMFGQDFNSHTYSLMTSCADHLHWVGGNWTEARGGAKHHEAGGGHAHVGAMVYLGDNWPDEYRNHLLTCNVHGNRLNQDILERKGSGYVAHHGRDFLMANDPWFRGLSVQYGPDGGVYVSDWTDTGECHNYETVDRTNGRIYKITYGQPMHEPIDLAKLTDEELVRLQLHKNDWQVRHARRILQERAAAGKLGNDVGPALFAILHERTTPLPSGERLGEVRAATSETAKTAQRLRGLWALYVTGHATEKLLVELMDDPQDVVRSWAIQLAVQGDPHSRPVLTKLAALARDDPSTWVRLAVASALQRLNVSDRKPIAVALVSHAEDASDENLTRMIWYGIEPLVAADREAALEIARAAEIPLLRQYIARRTVSAQLGNANALGALIKEVGDQQRQLDLLLGLRAALAGRRRVEMPPIWSELYKQLAASPNAAIRDTTTRLALLFGDDRAFKSLRKRVTDTAVDSSARETAIDDLSQAKDAALPKLLFALLAEPAMCGPAVRALAAFDEQNTPRQIFAHYGDWPADAKRDAIGTLASRVPYAMALIDAIDHNKIPRGDVTAFHVQQLNELKNDRIAAWLAKNWGAVRQTPADKAAAIARYKAALTTERLGAANLSQGRAVFARTCANCHTLFDAGGKIGPELTGSQRANLDYVLTNVIDPSAVVARDYQMTSIQTADGRVLSGIIKQENEHGVTVQTATEIVVLPKDEIEARQQQPISMMPEGLIATLSDDEMRDLVAYLASPQQVALPER